jgi:hypothetical protein
LTDIALPKNHPIYLVRVQFDETQEKRAQAFAWWAMSEKYKVRYYRSDEPERMSQAEIGEMSRLVKQFMDYSKTLADGDASVL